MTPPPMLDGARETAFLCQMCRAAERWTRLVTVRECSGVQCPGGAGCGSALACPACDAGAKLAAPDS